MAKQIKAIKCPQCGSTDKTEIKPDFFRCNSCNTEYFLDNDDVNINYNHSYTSGTTYPSKNPLKIVYIIFAVFIVLAGIISLFFTGSEHKTNSSPPYSTYEGPKEKEFSSSRYHAFPFLQSGTDKACIVYVEERSYNASSDGAKSGVYLTIYTPDLKKPVSEQKIGDHKLSGSQVVLKKFSNGKVYLIVNKTTLYSLDMQDLKFKDCGKEVFGKEPDLQVGVATVDFTYNDDGDGFIILTNDGKNFTYFPEIKKLYTKDELGKANQGFKTLLPGAKEEVYYTFTSTSTEYPEEKRQLLKILYKDNPGGPKDMATNPSWGKDYGGSGIFTGRDPYKKVMFTPYSKERARIINWKDLTPGRLYFDPSVLLYDKQNLIIKFNNSANLEAPKSIQKLNINTGTIEWTLPIDKMDLDGIIATKTGFLALVSIHQTLIISKDGKLTSTYKFD